MLKDLKILVAGGDHKKKREIYRILTRINHHCNIELIITPNKSLHPRDMGVTWAVDHNIKYVRYTSNQKPDMALTLAGSLELSKQLYEQNDIKILYNKKAGSLNLWTHIYDVCRQTKNEGCRTVDFHEKSKLSWKKDDTPCCNHCGSPFMNY